MHNKHILRTGITLDTELAGRPCTVRHPIGEGGQAEVWCADLDGQEVALKWFRNVQLQRDPDTASRLRTLVRIPAPSRAFLWPIDIVRSGQLPGIGYVMPLLPPNYVNLDAVLRGAVPNLHPRMEALICHNLALEFGRLHRLEGMAYRDINKFNVYFDVGTGDVRIIDNDNVSVNGSPSIMRGFPGFMAPELECDPAQQTSRYSDLHSLAVVFFRLLMRGDPFVGAFELYPFDNEHERRLALYGLHPLFVFHPSDERNRPVSGRHDQMLIRWNYHPEFLRDCFMNAFIEGLFHPTRRVTHGVWQQVMLRLHDAYFECRACTAQHYYGASDAGELRCWHCSAPLGLPARLRITRSGLPHHVLMLEHGTKLRLHHVAFGQGADFSRVLGVYSSSPPSLRNLSGTTWRVLTEQGSRFDVEHGAALDFTLRNRVHVSEAVYFETQPESSRRLST